MDFHSLLFGTLNSLLLFLYNTLHKGITPATDNTQSYVRSATPTTTPEQESKMMFFGFGNLIYIVVLLTNAIAILSEDRFLARIGWSNTVQDRGFGQVGGDTSIKHKLINLMTSVRTLMRIPLILINTVIIIYELFLG